MDKITVQFILLTICLPSVDTAISKVYEANPDLYNTKSTNEPLSFKQTDSLLLCSKLYVSGYNCFNFNIQTGTCLLYNSCNSSNMTVSESGWRFFTDVSLEQEGEYMLAHYFFYHFSISNWEQKMHYHLLTHLFVVLPISITDTLYMYILGFFFFIYPVFIILVNFYILFCGFVMRRLLN